MDNNYDGKTIALITIPALADTNSNFQSWTMSFVVDPTKMTFNSRASGYRGEWQDILLNHESLGMEIHPDAVIEFFNDTDDDDPDLSDFFNHDIEEIHGPQIGPWRKTVTLKKWADMLTRRGVHWIYATDWLEQNQTKISSNF